MADQAMAIANMLHHSLSALSSMLQCGLPHRTLTLLPLSAVRPDIEQIIQKLTSELVNVGLTQLRQGRLAPTATIQDVIAAAGP